MLKHSFSRSFKRLLHFLHFMCVFFYILARRLIDKYSRMMIISNNTLIYSFFRFFANSNTDRSNMLLRAEGVLLFEVKKNLNTIFLIMSQPHYASQKKKIYWIMYLTKNISKLRATNLAVIIIKTKTIFASRCWQEDKIYLNKMVNMFQFIIHRQIT